MESNPRTLKARSCFGFTLAALAICLVALAITIRGQPRVVEGKGFKFGGGYYTILRTKRS